jgi:hypothetical protein
LRNDTNNFANYCSFSSKESVSMAFLISASVVIGEA